MPRDVPEMSEENVQMFIKKYDVSLEEPIQDVDQWNTIEELDFSAKDLRNIPPELWEMAPANLKMLAADNNRLEQLPEELSLLTQLTELYLRENQLEALPKSLGKLEHLEGLYLENNNLTAHGIPEDLGRLQTCLQGLCLHRNKLEVSR